MPAHCKVCPNLTSHFSFPKERSRRFKWMNILEMTDVPEPRAQLCTLHFAIDDFFYDGRKVALMDGAVPLPLNQVQI